MIFLPSPFPLHCGMKWIHLLGVPMIIPFIHDTEVVSEANISRFCYYISPMWRLLGSVACIHDLSYNIS